MIKKKIKIKKGLPLQVRDTILNTASEMPTSDINLQYYSQNMDKQVIIIINIAVVIITIIIVIFIII